VLYGLIWGARVAFRVGLLITLGRVLIGVPVGMVAGYYGGRLDALMMRATDAFLAFPVVAGVLLMLAVTVDVWGIRLGEGDRAIVLALILFGWMQYARLVRGNVLVERAKEYVQAAVSIGAGGPRIILRHVLPNATNGLFVLIASDIGAMVVTVAALTFIGLSGDEPTADWGMILKFARNWVIGGPANAFEYWYTYIPPIVAIVLFSIGWNLIGDGLRDALDPQVSSYR
jgi:peptide/nickel transport system permease protein